MSNSMRKFKALPERKKMSVCNFGNAWQRIEEEGITKEEFRADVKERDKGLIPLLDLAIELDKDGYHFLIYEYVHFQPNKSSKSKDSNIYIKPTISIADNIPLTYIMVHKSELSSIANA